MSSTGWNTLLIVLLLIGCAMWLGWRFLRKSNAAPFAKQLHEWSWERLDNVIKQTFLIWTNDLVMDFYADEEQYKREMQRRLALKKSLRSCCSGDPADKEYIKEWIVDIISNHIKLSQEDIERLIPFDDPIRLTSQDKFDLLLYSFKQRYQYDALHELIQRYKWDDLKTVTTESDKESSYVVTVEELNDAFRQERMQFQMDDRLRIVAQRLYQRYKGFSVIDEIRDMRIDGVSGGVNGVPEDAMNQTGRFVHSSRMAKATQHRSEETADFPIRSCDSVWVFYKGKSIRFAFLSFGNEAELKRVCQNIYKYQSPGPLTEADGFRVNHMKDGSRVVVLRPPFAESWAFFVRKFDTEFISLEQLITDRNADIPVTLLQYLMKGARVTSITGAQGSGKTTLLMALVRAIYPFYPLRVQEQAFELHLRRLYPERNVLTLRETERITGQAGLDVQKKTDGVVHILGEVATDPVAAWMIQMAQVASLFTIFTHHAKTFPDLVFSLRNSLLKTGMFHNESIAEQQVTGVIHFDVHLSRDADGKRYIERITECIPVRITDDGSSDVDTAEQMQPVTWEDFIMSSERLHRQLARTQQFKYRNIVEYQHGRYFFVHPISKHQQEAMEKEMTAEDKRRFREWIAREGGLPIAG
ncbi:Flp pilus assembly complex ATPase component TadA [Paenibacillus sp. MER TA 81-3]|uniref:ATPase, T2SS/T4P/T4SS family n=1 Tax=Paenibacillus sp. MER TA 81-3 TaxID=2939573 RepID=UPI00203EA39F|nr:ATPase, T2SS/T4P/T4SS family [Paenibacillus sp. MER TA 81-3]MCM3339920.1 Flp pilus assembly complex ATPase component TadA [Paenibacillus sp. MER TA 81-3]